jgi:hypothetical protein
MPAGAQFDNVACIHVIMYVDNWQTAILFCFCRGMHVTLCLLASCHARVWPSAAVDERDTVDTSAVKGQPARGLQGHASEQDGLPHV